MAQRTASQHVFSSLCAIALLLSLAFEEFCVAHGQQMPIKHVVQFMIESDTAIFYRFIWSVGTQEFVAIIM